MKKVTNSAITDVICDCCGKSCKKMLSEAFIKKDEERQVNINDEIIPQEYTFEFMELEAHWGYFSDKDTEHWTAHICEKCVDEKFSFIKFEKTHYL